MRWILQKVLSFFRDKKAVTAPIVAVMIALLLTIAGLVVDLGHIYVVKQELQNAADAGAHAGAMALFSLPTGSGSEPAPADIMCSHAKTTALATVQLQKSDGANLTIPSDDVVIGVWEYVSGKWTFTPQYCNGTMDDYEINAVRVTTRRTTAVNGPVNSIFAKFLGKDYTELTAQATAFLGYVRSIPKGRGFPIAIGDNWVPEPGKSKWVTFTPDWTDTGGWHTFFDNSASAQDLKELVNGTQQGDGLAVHDYINCNNGADASVYAELKKQLAIEVAEHGSWTVVLPIVPSSSQFNQEREVLGFCIFEITEVNATTSDKFCSGWARGGWMLPSSDTGGSTGLKADHPKLVQ